MNQIPKFSIIIPMYNSEKTIGKCLQTIQQQTEPSFEVLIIDDGSTDKSVTICEKMISSDKRFNILCQNNAGPSSARNHGLNCARGQFVTFIDSDDTVELNYLEQIRKKFDSSEADVVFIGYTRYFPNGKKEADYVPEQYSSNYYEMLTELSNRDLFGYTWIKAFRRSVIGTIRFSVNMNLFEDEIFTCEILQNCHSVAVVNYPIYHYVYGNENSLMGRIHQDYCEKQNKVYLAWETLLSNYSLKEEFLQKKAEKMMCACKYYGFERNIEVQKFFESLMKCTFGVKCQNLDPFLDHLRNNNIKALEKMRKRYRLKIIVARLLGR